MSFFKNYKKSDDRVIVGTWKKLYMLEIIVSLFPLHLFLLTQFCKIIFPKGYPVASMPPQLFFSVKREFWLSLHSSMSSLQTDM